MSALWPADIRPECPHRELRRSSRGALCEVKTINVSDIEAYRRFSGGVGRGTDHLTIGFFGKLASDLAQAQAQMAAFDADPAVTEVAYVIINFDDSSHEYADRYRGQIER